jgi:hypothetical protein
LRQEVLLFITRIEAILIGFLLLHALQYSMYAVKCQIVPTTPLRVYPRAKRRAPKGTRLLSLRLEAEGFTARFDKFVEGDGGPGCCIALTCFQLRLYQGDGLM